MCDANTNKNNNNTGQWSEIFSLSNNNIYSYNSSNNYIVIIVRKMSRRQLGLCYKSSAPNNI